MDYSNEQNEKAFDERADAFTENRTHSLSANMDHSKKDTAFVPDRRYKERYAHGSDENEQNEKAFDDRADAFAENRDHSLSAYMDHSKKDAAFVPDRKFKERYAHRSLENTNVFDTAGHTNEIYEQQNTSDMTSVVEASDETDESLNDKNNFEKQEGNDSIDFISREEVDNQDINPGKEMSDTLKQTEVMSDYPEQQKYPLTSIDNSSDMMVLYLMYNDLQKKIEDLEVKEHRACSKHLWEETLRLREMRNRLELLRERKIYQRRDLHIDPSSKEAALENIEKRSIQLKGREDTCADSKMYSEDAKRIWNKWIQEDKKSPISEGDNLREALMNQLADEWESLAENDKKIISQSYAEVMKNASLEVELDILAKKGFH